MRLYAQKGMRRPSRDIMEMQQSRSRSRSMFQTSEKAMQEMENPKYLPLSRNVVEVDDTLVGNEGFAAGGVPCVPECRAHSRMRWGDHCLGHGWKRSAGALPCRHLVPRQHRSADGDVAFRRPSGITRKLPLKGAMRSFSCPAAGNSNGRKDRPPAR